MLLVVRELVMVCWDVAPLVGIAVQDVVEILEENAHLASLKSGQWVCVSWSYWGNRRLVVWHILWRS